MVSLSGIWDTVTSPAVDAYHAVKNGAEDAYNTAKNGAVDTFQSVLNDAKEGYNAVNDAVGGNLVDRGLGVLQAGAGVVEFGVGTVGGVLTSETGVGAVIGAGVALHGLDDIQAGVRQASTGKPTETFTQQGVTSLAQHAGAPPRVAIALGIGADMAAGGGVGGAEKAAIKGTEAAVKGVETVKEAETAVKGAEAAKQTETAVKGAEESAKAAETAGRAKTYQTYTKTKPETGQVYSGRTSGKGTPVQNVARRDLGHHKTAEGFGPAVLDKSSPNANAIRGREEQLIQANGGPKKSGGTSGNDIHGISPKNPKREKYLGAAEREFGPF